jgi:hypothetical protein
VELVGILCVFVVLGGCCQGGSGTGWYFACVLCRVAASRVGVELVGPIILIYYDAVNKTLTPVQCLHDCAVVTECPQQTLIQQYIAMVFLGTELLIGEYNWSLTS